MRQASQTIRGILLLTVAGCLAGAGTLAAGTDGRIQGTVVDPAGQPIEGVAVTVSAREVERVRQETTNKKGKFTITLLDASRRFDIRLEKEGFQVIEEEIDPKIGGTLKKSWTMVPGQTIEPEQLAELERKDKAARLYNDGVKKFGGGDIDGAYELFQESLAEDAELGLAHLAMARIHLARDQFAEALPHAEKAAELVAEEPLSQLVYFDSLWGVDEKERALPVLDRLAADGGLPEKTAVRVFNAGVHAVQANDLDAAKARFEQALALDPTLQPANLTLAQIAMAQEEFQAALDYASAYLEAAPDEARALSVAYQANRALGREEEAQAAFAKLAASDPERVIQTFHEEGVTHFNAGRNAQAIASFQQVLQADPQHARTIYMLGLCYASAGDVDKAREHLTRFIELAPDDPDAAVARDMLSGL